MSDCAVHNAEVFVADNAVRGQLRVFSLDGQHRRDILGAFERPLSLRLREDRIYLIEIL